MPFNAYMFLEGILHLSFLLEQGNQEAHNRIIVSPCQGCDNSCSDVQFSLTCLGYQRHKPRAGRYNVNFGADLHISGLASGEFHPQRMNQRYYSQSWGRRLFFFLSFIQQMWVCCQVAIIHKKRGRMVCPHILLSCAIPLRHSTQRHMQDQDKHLFIC